MQKENHRSGQCWCMAPPSCPLTIGDVNLERYPFSSSFFPLSCPHNMMISMVGKSCRGTLPSRQKKKNHERIRGARASFISLYICALWSDHTLNIFGCRCGLIGASYTTHPPPTHSFWWIVANWNVSKKKKRKSRMVFFFFLCVCVMTVHVFICTATAALSVTAPCFHPAPHFLQEKRISGEKISYHFVGLFFLRYFVFSSSSLFIIVPIDWADWEDVVVSISLDPLFIFIQ